MDENIDTGFVPVVDYAPAYAGGTLNGIGRWFQTDSGFVWTDDTGHLNLLDFNDAEAAHDFITHKNLISKHGLSASEAFDSIATADGEGEYIISHGNLATLSDLFDQAIIAKRQETVVTAAAVPDAVEYGITLDDDGSVLELVKFDANGGAIRDAGNWLPLDPNAEENDDDTVFGREWVDVDEGAVAVYDENADADSLTKDIFIPHILN